MKQLNNMLEKRWKAAKKVVSPLAVLAILAVLAMPAQAQRSGSFTPFTSNVAYNSTSNGVGTAVSVLQGQSLTIWPRIHCSTNSTATMTFSFNVSPDGSNWTTTLPIAVTATANGKSTVMTFSNVASSAIAGVKQIRLDQVINGDTNTSTSPLLVIEDVQWIASPNWITTAPRSAWLTQPASPGVDLWIGDPVMSVLADRGFAHWRLKPYVELSPPRTMIR